MKDWTNFRPCDHQPVLKSHERNGIWIKRTFKNFRMTNRTVLCWTFFCINRVSIQYSSHPEDLSHQLGWRFKCMPLNVAFGRCMWVRWSPLFVVVWLISPFMGSMSVLEKWLVPTLEAVTWAFWLFSLFRQKRLTHLLVAHPTCYMPGTGVVTLKWVISFNPFNNAVSLVNSLYR